MAAIPAGPILGHQASNDVLNAIAPDAGALPVGDAVTPALFQQKRARLNMVSNMNSTDAGKMAAALDMHVLEHRALGPGALGMAFKSFSTSFTSSFYPCTLNYRYLIVAYIRCNRFRSAGTTGSPSSLGGGDATTASCHATTASCHATTASCHATTASCHATTATGSI